MGAPLVLAALWMTAGCAAPHKVRVTETGAPKYKRVDITYSPGRLAAWPSSGTVVSTSLADHPAEKLELETWSRVCLRIEYPHPEGRAEFARATLQLSRTSEPTGPAKTSLREKMVGGLGGLFRNLSRTSPKGPPPQSSALDSDDESWVLDFPRQQLDLLLIDLAEGGFFDDQRRPTGGVQLAVRIDRGRASKSWNTEPRLDDFVTRTRREGKLVR